MHDLHHDDEQGSVHLENAKLYKKLEQTKFKCALTGMDLAPESFELDHIIPMEDGGKDTIDNLQFVHPLVNRAKGTMPQSQFVAMCHAVVKLHPDP